MSDPLAEADDNEKRKQADKAGKAAKAKGATKGKGKATADDMSDD
jgi:hypothetical protein